MKIDTIEFKKSHQKNYICSTIKIYIYIFFKKIKIIKYKIIALNQLDSRKNEKVHIQKVKK